MATTMTFAESVQNFWVAYYEKTKAEAVQAAATVRSSYGSLKKRTSAQSTDMAEIEKYVARMSQ